LVAVLDMPESPEPVYHLSAGTRWSVPEWCRHLHETFPDFQYRMTEDLGMCTVGRNKAVLRSPMSIVRICRDTDYKPAFLLEQAFTDFLAWNANARACGWV
jgi:nucleoside-diphosphate-sugar epimerase